MEQWKSPRRIEEERQAAIEAERQRVHALFDDLAELVSDGVINMEQLKAALETPSGELYVTEATIER